MVKVDLVMREAEVVVMVVVVVVVVVVVLEVVMSMREGDLTVLVSLRP